MKQRHAQKGQGVIESLVSLPLLLAVSIVIAHLLYRSWVYYLADYHLHEALICTEHQDLSTCHTELRKRIKKILLPSSHAQIDLQKKVRSMSGKVTVDLYPPLTISKNYRRH